MLREKKFGWFDQAPPRLGRVGRKHRLLRDPAGHPGGTGDPTGDPTGGGSGAPPAPPAGGPKTFDQDAVNSIVKRELEKERTKHQETMKEQTRKTLEEINTLRDQKDLTEEARARLDTRATELETDLMTEREKATAEQDRLTKQHTKALDESTADRDQWRGRFETSSRETAVVAAASKHGAVSAVQIMALVAPLANVTEVKDDKGVGTGSYAVLIPNAVADEKGVVTQVEQTPDEYIAWMKTQPEHENLFLSQKPGGTGFRPGQGAPGSGAPLTGTDAIASGLKKGQQKQAAPRQVL